MQEKEQSDMSQWS